MKPAVFSAHHFHLSLLHEALIPSYLFFFLENIYFCTDEVTFKYREAKASYFVMGAVIYNDVLV